MNNNSNFIRVFFTTTYTLSQARARLRLLRSYLMSYFFRPKADQPLAGQDPWLTSLGENFFKEFSQNNVYQKLKELEGAISHIDPLVIYVAFDMPEEELNQLGVWIRQNLKNDLVFDIKIDTKLIAGCAVSFKGRYKDYSLRPRINENRDKILTNLKSFTK